MLNNQIILKDPEIRLIVRRMAFQIAENNLGFDNLLVVGLNARGFFLAELIVNELNTILPKLEIQLSQLPVDELTKPILKSTNILIVDDVLNSGKTAFMAAAACMHEHLIKFETAFLAVREHRSFPVLANYVGLSVATTLQDHVFFDNENPDTLCVYLK